MTERWEADAKKPAPFRAGFRTSGRGERPAEQRPDADAGIDPAFADPLDRDIEAHRTADLGDPALALDIFGGVISRDTNQRTPRTEELRVGNSGVRTSRKRQ